MRGRALLAILGFMMLSAACWAPMQYRADYSEWPDVQSAVPLDVRIERRIDRQLQRMTLAEKIGQMVQPEISMITPAQVKEFHIGSVLNGGGSWPGGDKFATVHDWLALADAYWEASMDGGDGFMPIPVIWGTDAVHGHSNVIGTTLFPHNIGLGAARDPGLLRRIGNATARQVVATGIDWTFAPTLAVVRDDRWGRAYEGYSEDGQVVFEYGGEMVMGLQGDFGAGHVVATAKHYIGDGGTVFGVDQGDNVSSELELINLHAQGYYSALAAGAQTVMASFNSWEGEKLHGQAYLLTEVLKGKLGFDGFVVSDWNGIGQVEGCTNVRCPQAINAGIDMIMVPYEWQAFIANTLLDVQEGAISMERVDDAVRRILRVKHRAGLFAAPRPSERRLAGAEASLHGPKVKRLAREAVQKSMVLLKNEANALPLAKTGRFLVVGKTADDIGNQSGGWTLSWQGTGNQNEDFPYATSIFDGLVEVMGGQGELVLDPDASHVDGTYDAIVAVIGETPYAEGYGDISRFSTLAFGRHYPADAALLQRVRELAPSTPIVTVYVGGRPLWMNPEINRSDAFVAAWLPGTEGAGVADVLFGDRDFSGKLSFSWPAQDCQVPLNRGDGQEALFPYGHGLQLASATTVPLLDETQSSVGCDAAGVGDGSTIEEPLALYVGGSVHGDYAMRIGGTSNWGGIDVDLDPTAVSVLPDGELSVGTVDGSSQQSAKRLTWNGTAQLYLQSSAWEEVHDFTAYANSQTTLAVDVKVIEPPAEATTDVSLSAHCVYPCYGDVNIAADLRSMEVGSYRTLRVPLACLLADGLDVSSVNTPFLLYSAGPMTVEIENVRWEPFTASETPSCESFLD